MIKSVGNVFTKIRKIHCFSLSLLWEGFVSISSFHSPKIWRQQIMNNPISFFQAPNSRWKWFLCRRHRALELRFEKVLSAILHITLQTFSNNNCWQFQFHSSKLPIAAKSGFCAEGIEHWSFALRRFCQHFFTIISKNFGKIIVDHSIFILSNF